MTKRETVTIIGEDLVVESSNQPSVKDLKELNSTVLALRDELVVERIRANAAKRVADDKITELSYKLDATMKDYSNLGRLLYQERKLTGELDQKLLDKQKEHDAVLKEKEKALDDYCRSLGDRSRDIRALNTEVSIAKQKMEQAQREAAKLSEKLEASERKGGAAMLRRIRELQDYVDMLEGMNKSQAKTIIQLQVELGDAKTETAKAKEEEERLRKYSLDLATRLEERTVERNTMTAERNALKDLVVRYGTSTSEQQISGLTFERDALAATVNELTDEIRVLKDQITSDSDYNQRIERMRRQYREERDRAWSALARINQLSANRE